MLVSFGRRGRYTGGNRLDYNWIRDTEPANGAFAKSLLAIRHRWYPSSIAAWGNKIYYVGENNAIPWNFGTIDSSGVKTSIATGLNLGAKYLSERLMFAPNGLFTRSIWLRTTSVAGKWGTINSSERARSPKSVT